MANVSCKNPETVLWKKSQYQSYTNQWQQGKEACEHVPPARIPSVKKCARVNARGKNASDLILLRQLERNSSLARTF